MSLVLFFFFNDTATTEIYTLSLHDALPILVVANADIATGMPFCTALPCQNISSEDGLAAKFLDPTALCRRIATVAG